VITEDQILKLEKEINSTLSACPFCGEQPQYSMSRYVGQRSTIRCDPCAVVMGETARGNWRDLPDRWNAWAAKAPEITQDEADQLMAYRRKTGKNAAPWPRIKQRKAGVPDADALVADSQAWIEKIEQEAA